MISWWFTVTRSSTLQVWHVSEGLHSESRPVYTLYPSRSWLKVSVSKFIFVGIYVCNYCYMLLLMLLHSCDIMNWLFFPSFFFLKSRILRTPCQVYRWETLRDAGKGAWKNSVIQKKEEKKNPFCHADWRPVGLRPKPGCSEPKVEAFLSGFPCSQDLGSRCIWTVLLLHQLLLSADKELRLFGWWLWWQLLVYSK